MSDDMKSLGWKFLEHGSGRVPADSMANPLRNTRLSPGEVLMREALQNSFDERTGEDKLVFKVTRHRLVDRKKSDLAKLLKFDEILGKHDQFPDNHQWMKKGPDCLTILNNPKSPLYLLEIADYNANGLGGEWNKSMSHNNRFFNLVLSLYNTTKQLKEDKASLGSYGVGKMVFALCSNMRTMFYHSKYRCEESGEACYRFMGTAFLPMFKDDQHEYSGHAYFGLDSGELSNPKKPVEGEAVADFLEGIYPGDLRNSKGGGRFGTSVILPFCDIDIKEIKAAIEKWWWPLLTSPTSKDEIEIILEDSDGMGFPPDLTDRPELSPYIASLNNLEGKQQPEHTAVTEIKAKLDSKTKVAGKLAAIRGKREMQPQYKNRVALVRGGLVIRYHEFLFAEREDFHCAGVFQTTDNLEIRRHFIFSEPEAHDDWNSNHDRLLMMFGDAGQTFVRNAIQQIKNKSRDFQTQQENDEIRDQQTNLRFINNMLGDIIDGPDGPPPKPNGGKRAIYITKRATKTNGGKTNNLSFTISARPECDIDKPTLFNLHISHAALINANHKKGDLIKCATHVEHFDKNGEPAVSDAASDEKGLIKVPFHLAKGLEVTGNASADVHESWTTSWSISVDRSD